MADITRAPAPTPPAQPPSADTLPPQPISAEVLLEKYAKGDERSAEQVNLRVAQALAQAEDPAQRNTWQARFAWALQQGFVPPVASSRPPAPTWRPR